MSAQRLAAVCITWVIWRPLHCVCLARACLTICKDADVVPVCARTHKRQHLFKHLCLRKDRGDILTAGLNVCNAELNSYHKVKLLPNLLQQPTEAQRICVGCHAVPLLCTGRHPAISQTCACAERASNPNPCHHTSPMREAPVKWPAQTLHQTQTPAHGDQAAAAAAAQAAGI